MNARRESPEAEGEEKINLYYSSHSRRCVFHLCCSSSAVPSFSLPYPHLPLLPRKFFTSFLLISLAWLLCDEEAYWVDPPSTSGFIIAISFPPCLPRKAHEMRFPYNCSLGFKNSCRKHFSNWNEKRRKGREQSEERRIIQLRRKAHGMSWLYPVKNALSSSCGNELGCWC